MASSVIAHAALLAVLLFAPGFRQQRLSALGNATPLNMIPGDLVDAALAPGPAPKPVEPPPTSNPTSTPSEPETATPPRQVPPPLPAGNSPPPTAQPTPSPTPTPKTPSQVKFDLPTQDGPGFVLPSNRAAEKPKKPERETPRFDFSKARSLKPPVTRKPDRPSPDTAEDEDSAAAEQNRSRIQDLARKMETASGSLSRSSERGTVRVQVSTGGPAGGEGGGGGGGGGGAVSAYAWAVRNAYDNAWVAPQGVDDDLATTVVEVVLRKDGRVVSSRISKRSGVAALDRSVHDTLNRVTRVPPFENGATDDQRSFTIGFNMRGKRSL